LTTTEDCSVPKPQSASSSKISKACKSISIPTQMWQPDGPNLKMLETTHGVLSYLIVIFLAI
jgi:hypothetical protein